MWTSEGYQVEVRSLNEESPMVYICQPDSVVYQIELQTLTIESPMSSVGQLDPQRDIK